MSSSSSASSSSSLEPSTSTKKRKAHAEIAVDLTLPEPPSKKAKRAFKKGKPIPDTKTKKKHSKHNDDDADLRDDGDEEDGENKDNADADAPKSAKATCSEYSIWLGNLSFRTTRLTLTNWLVSSSGGAVTPEKISRVKLPMTTSSTQSRGARGGRNMGEGGGGSGQTQNKGFAYVDFTDEMAWVAAKGLTETELDGRRILIKGAGDFEGRPDPPPAADAEETTANGADGEAGAGGASGDSDAEGIHPQRLNNHGIKPTKPNTPAKAKASNATNNKIFVGNLPFNTTSEDLEAHFSKCGTLAWAKVATFEDSGKCKGYAWVRFADHEVAVGAVRGWVKIPDPDAGDGLEVEDFEEEVRGDDEEADSEEKDEEKTDKQKKGPKLRKWYVNRLMGRDLKIQFAEDDQTRYKKRYGAGGTKNKDSQEGSGRGRGGSRGGRGGRGRGGSSGGDGRQETEGGKDERSVAYRTGGMVEGKGKKVVF